MRAAVDPHAQQAQALESHIDLIVAGLLSCLSVLVVEGGGFQSEDLEKVSNKHVHATGLTEILTTVNKAYAMNIGHSYSELCSKRSGNIGLERFVVASYNGFGKATHSWNSDQAGMSTIWPTDVEAIEKTWDQSSSKILLSEWVVGKPGKNIDLFVTICCGADFDSNILGELFVSG